jgi:hypothetical protein
MRNVSKVAQKIKHASYVEYLFFNHAVYEIIWKNMTELHMKNPTRCNSVPKFISYLCEAQHVSGDTPPIIRSLKLH